MSASHYIADMGVPTAWDELEFDDLPNDELRLVAKDFGLSVAIGIWRRLAGTPLSLPTRFPRDFAIRFIRAHYDGHNAPQLARSLGLTMRTVQDYLGARPAPRRHVDERQTEFSF